MQDPRYPFLNIKSKKELAKRLSQPGISPAKMLALINDVELHFDNYWKDNLHESEPDKGKFVRTAKGTPLEHLLDLLNRKLLARNDHLLPRYIFGGPSRSDHVKAARHLLGKKRFRSLLKADIKRFFECIEQDRVQAFFAIKCGCSMKVARLLGQLACVPIGKKGLQETRSTIARGFATSQRLAFWCNLDIFIKLNRLVTKRLKGYDPRLAIYVDDIGVTASRVSKTQLENLYAEMEYLLMNSDPNQQLPLNAKKKEIRRYDENMQILGLVLERNKLRVKPATQSKRDRLRRQIKTAQTPKERSALRRRYRGIRRHEGYVQQISKQTD